MARTQKIRSDTVRVTGLRELNRALRAIGPEAQKESREASRGVAKFVANDARSAAYSIGSTAAHVAPTIKPVGGATSAGVAFGGTAWPEAGGAAWGSVRYKQFKPWRGKLGYFPYPQIVSNEDRIVHEYEEAIGQVLKRHFPLPIN